MTTYNDTERGAGAQGSSPGSKTERTILPNKMIGAARSGPLLLWAMLEHKMLEDTDLGEVDFGELADRLQWHRATVYRWRDALEDKGLLEWDGRPGHKGRHIYCLAYPRGTLHLRNGQARKGALQIDIRLYYEHDLSPDAILLFTYLERQTLSRFTWKAARNALNLTRRRLESARDQLQAKGLINGHETVNLSQNRTGCSENRHNSEADKCSNLPERPETGGESGNLSQNRTDAREDSQPVAEMAEPVADIGQPVAEPYGPSVQHVLQHYVQHPHSNGTCTDSTLSVPNGVKLPDRVEDSLESRKSDRRPLQNAIAEAWNTLPAAEPINDALEELAAELRKSEVRSMGKLFRKIHERKADKYQEKIRERGEELDREVKRFGDLFPEPYVDAFREAISQHVGWEKYRRQLIVRSLNAQDDGGPGWRSAHNHFCLTAEHAGRYAGTEGDVPCGILVQDFDTFLKEAFDVDLLDRMKQTRYVRELQEMLSQLAGDLVWRDGRIIDPAEPEHLIREFFATAVLEYWPEKQRDRNKVAKRATEQGHNDLNTSCVVGAYRFWLREHHPEREQERQAEIERSKRDNTTTTRKGRHKTDATPEKSTSEKVAEYLERLEDADDPENRELYSYMLRKQYGDALSDDQRETLETLAPNDAAPA